MTLAQESIDSRESDIIRKLVEHNLKTEWFDGKNLRRGQHAKSHGCVEGTFTVVDGIPEQLAHGVFKPGKTYSCVARFSNGAQQDDRNEDVRGLAIKLKGITGEKLLPGSGDKDEQDFILVDHPTYFTSTMDEYIAFNRYFTPVQSLRSNGFSPIRAIRAAWGLVVLLLFYRKILKAARAFAGRHAASPLALTYHSTTPYLLGAGLAVKYKVIGSSKSTDDNIEAENGMGDALWAALADRPQTLEFGVLLQKNAVDHPIEDPSVDWEANNAEYVKLADLTLAQQENSAEKQAQSLGIKFNPWMSIAMHKPLGGINRARLLIYSAMSQRRTASKSGT